MFCSRAAFNWAANSKKSANDLINNTKLHVTFNHYRCALVMLVESFHFEFDFDFRFAARCVESIPIRMMPDKES